MCLLLFLQLEFCELDVSSMASVQAFAQALTARLTHLDVLINNAGVMLKVKRHTPPPLLGT